MTRLALIPFLIVACAMAQVRPAVERIDAILGHPLLVPVQAADGKEILRGVSVRLDDGHEPAVSYFRLEQAGAADAGWIGPVPRYRAVPAADARDEGATPGVWYAVVELPLEAVSQGLWFGDTRYEVNWLPDPERAALESGGVPLWASSMPPGALGSDRVAAALDAVARDPFQRWRVRLAQDGIAPTGGADRTGSEGTDLAALRDDLGRTPGGRFLDELARHHEARWQLILGRMALIDQEAAARLRRRLAGAVWMDGAWTPMWTPDTPELRALQVDLLSPWVDDETRVLRALGWLDAQPKALAWVIDDAGAPGFEPARLTATLGVLSLPARDTNLLLQVAGSMDGPQLETAPPRRSVAVRTSVPMLEQRGRGTAVRTTAVPVRIGREETAPEAVATVPAARPPGVRVGPLLRGWTMPALLDQAPEQNALPAPDRVASGRLRRVARPRTPDDRSGWSVYLRCAAPADAEDAVTVWAGPYGLPRGVWRIERDGTVHRLFGGSDLAGLTVVETEDGWSLDAVLPESAVGDDGVLRVGLVRELAAPDGRTERTSWPRRLTPGADEPGRLPVDVTRWRGF